MEQHFRSMCIFLLFYSFILSKGFILGQGRSGSDAHPNKSRREVGLHPGWDASLLCGAIQFSLANPPTSRFWEGWRKLNNVEETHMDMEKLVVRVKAGTLVLCGSNATQFPSVWIYISLIQNMLWYKTFKPSDVFIAHMHIQKCRRSPADMVVCLLTQTLKRFLEAFNISSSCLWAIRAVPWLFDCSLHCSHVTVALKA